MEKTVKAKKISPISYIALFLSLIPFLFGIPLLLSINIYLIIFGFLILVAGLTLTGIGLMRKDEKKILLYISLALNAISLFVCAMTACVIIFIFLVHLGS
ncbi:hypothetical protein WD019_08220 [Fictibacillus sp. Mic-4]|uniref:hypothetical protein n=1 Tax=Fictibacillus TaxID=1329200 RepID=UPI00040FF6F7|nr:hypothetical protein [Fictibacillus gelatini]